MGVWNYIEKINNTDHINMVGQTQKSTHAVLQEKFFELAKMLNSIPVRTSASDTHICRARLYGYAGLQLLGT